MAYQKQTWYDLPNQTTPVNAERLNHIEDGIEEAFENGGSGVPVGTEVDFSGDTIPDGWEQVSGLNLTVYELYDNGTTGSSGNITLSDSSVNYDYLEIFFRNNDGDYSSIKVYHPDGKKIALSNVHPTGTSTGSNYMKTKTMTISGTSIQNQYYSEIAFNNGGSIAITGSNNIFITRVLGYKEE